MSSAKPDVLSSFSNIASVTSAVPGPAAPQPIINRIHQIYEKQSNSGKNAIMSTNLSLESLPLEGKEGNNPHPLVIIPFSLNPPFCTSVDRGERREGSKDPRRGMERNKSPPPRPAKRTQT